MIAASPQDFFDELGEKITLLAQEVRPGVSTSLSSFNPGQRLPNRLIPSANVVFFDRNSRQF
jgi:hypothetical protein